LATIISCSPEPSGKRDRYQQNLRRSDLKTILGHQEKLTEALVEVCKSRQNFSRSDMTPNDLRKAAGPGAIMATAEQLMTKEIEAIYEHEHHPACETVGVAGRSRLDVIVSFTRNLRTNRNAAVSYEIAALPLEGASDAFSGREHDSILYPKKPVS